MDTSLLSDSIEEKMLQDHVYQVSGDIWLRPLFERDAAQIFRLVNKNRERLSEWLYWVDQTLATEDEIAFIKHAKTNIINCTGLDLGLFVTNNEAKDSPGIFHQWKLIGMCGFVSIENSCGDIGYWIDGNYVGKGIVTMACKKLISVGFEKLALSQIKIISEPGNDNSLCVAKRLGFETNGKLSKINLFGKEVNIISYYKNKP